MLDPFTGSVVTHRFSHSHLPIAYMLARIRLTFVKIASFQNPKQTKLAFLLAFNIIICQSKLNELSKLDCSVSKDFFRAPNPKINKGHPTRGRYNNNKCIIVCLTM